MVIIGGGSWTIGERFDDRFDTEVGGYQTLVTQTVDESDNSDATQVRPPKIVDYQDHKYYSLEEAEVIPELAPVVQRLKERIVEFAKKNEAMTDQATKPTAPFFFQDECAQTPEEPFLFSRLRMRSTTTTVCGSGWTIGERFDDRFDTEVGGTQLMVTQSFNEHGTLEGGLPLPQTIADFAALPLQPSLPQIIDYQEGKTYTLDEAEVIPELAPVVQRLKERIAEYEAKKELSGS